MPLCTASLLNCGTALSLLPRLPWVNLCTNQTGAACKLALNEPVCEPGRSRPPTCVRERAASGRDRCQVAVCTDGRWRGHATQKPASYRPLWATPAEDFPDPADARASCVAHVDPQSAKAPRNRPSREAADGPVCGFGVRSLTRLGHQRSVGLTGLRTRPCTHYPANRCDAP